METSRLTRDRTAEPVSRDQILRRERGQGIIHLPCSADHEQDWQPHPVDPYPCHICDDHIYIDITVLANDPSQDTQRLNQALRSFFRHFVFLWERER